MRKSVDEPIFSKEINWNEVVPELERAIASSPHAAAALDSLVRMGCDRHKILTRLYMYGGGEAADVLAIKTAHEKIRQDVLALAQRLMDDAGEIERVNMDLARVGLPIENAPNEVMTSYGTLLMRLGNTTLRDLASERITGRDHHLVALMEMIKNAKHNPHGDPHYRELADLVNEVELKYESDYRRKHTAGVHTADSIRKLIDRWQDAQL